MDDLAEKAMLKQERLIFEMDAKRQQEMYNSWEEKIMQQRSISHEYRNNLLYMSALLEQGEYGKLSDYLKEASGADMRGMDVINTNNSVINVIMNTKYYEAKKAGADFIKIMTTGIMDFNAHGAVTGTPLDVAEVKEMVHIAHEEGMNVMSHTNGDYGVQAAVEAGVDSLEHGNYMNEDSLAMLAQSHTVWVPTLVTVRNLMGDGRYEDEVLWPIIESAKENVRKAFQFGIKVAPGSDAGAYRVLHGQGIQDEMDSFVEFLEEEKRDDVYRWLADGEAEIKKKFMRL